MARSSMHTDASSVIVRGHTLLCLQGFRGEGYSAPFVENLSKIHADLLQHPERLVTVVEEPDAVCAACPHQAVTGCQLNDDGSEGDMRTQDHDVLTRLGLESGQQVSWASILERIRDGVRGYDLPNICGRCRWLPLGYCSEGIERLQSDSTLPRRPASLILPTKRRAT